MFQHRLGFGVRVMFFVGLGGYSIGHGFQQKPVFTRGVQAASELLNSPGFQQLAVDVATNGTAREEVLRKVALSRQMRKFGDLIGLPRQELDPRIQFLQSAIQTGRQFAQEEQQ